MSAVPISPTPAEALAYIEAGLVLVAFDRGTKRPTHKGWNLREKCISTAITTHLVGIAAEAKAYPPALARYSEGCFDITAARLLIDRYNSAGRWPLLTFAAAAAAAVAFVDSRSKQIRALALALGNTGSLTDPEVRLFAGCGYGE